MKSIKRGALKALCYKQPNTGAHVVQLLEEGAVKWEVIALPTNEVLANKVYRMFAGIVKA